MSSLVIDRLFETCVKRDAEWVGIKAGEVPRIQLKNEQRTLAVPAVSQAEVEELAAKLLEFGSEPQIDGYGIRISVGYRDGFASFEVVIVAGDAAIQEVWIHRKRVQAEQQHSTSSD